MKWPIHWLTMALVRRHHLWIINRYVTISNQTLNHRTNYIKYWKETPQSRNSKMTIFADLKKHMQKVLSMLLLEVFCIKKSVQKHVSKFHNT